jgi:predicted DNA-binding transcriptional regulator AlpA
MVLDETDRLVDEREAAAILGGLKPQTLACWRLRGDGPAFCKIGRAVRYRLSDLAAYIKSRRCANTAEADALS